MSIIKSWGLATLLGILVTFSLDRFDWDASNVDWKTSLFFLACIATFVCATGFLMGIFGFISEKVSAQWRSWKEVREKKRRARKVNRKYQWRPDCISEITNCPDPKIITRKIQAVLDKGQISTIERDRLHHLAKVIEDLAEPNVLWIPTFSESDCTLLQRAGILQLARPNPALTSVIGWTALIMGMAAGLNFGVLAFSETSAGPGLLFSFLALASGLIWVKRKNRERKLAENS